MALAEIVAKKRDAVAARRSSRPLKSFQGRLAPSDRSLAAALARPHTGFILECKHASPSAGLLRSDYDPVAIARAYAPFADAISVLADEPFFGGSLEHVTAVRRAVTQPVLCKDIIVDRYQVCEARLHEADAVLLMASVLGDAELAACLQTARELSLDAVVEVHDDAELTRALALEPRPAIIGINNRDLKTLTIDLEVTRRLVARIPDDILVVGESGVKSHEDVRRLGPLVDALLVGSALMRQPSVSHAVRELVFGRVKVCGLTRPEDAVAAWESGASFGGLVFAPGSARLVTRAQAERVRQAAPLSWVGVFVDEPEAAVAELAAGLELRAVQLHGDESPANVAALRPRLPRGCAVWKAVRVAGAVPPLAATGADRLLLDAAARSGERGGSGESFDWGLIPAGPCRDGLILAGGLYAENVARADALGAWALDVSSGVEERRGIKSAAKLAAFFAALRGRSRAGSGAAAREVTTGKPGQRG